MKTITYEQVSDFIFGSLILLVVAALCSLNVGNPVMATAVSRMLLYGAVVLLIGLSLIDHDTPAELASWLSAHWKLLLLVAAVVFVFFIIPHANATLRGVNW